MSKSFLDVILLCPTGQDANLIASALESISINSRAVRTVENLCSLNLDEAGALMIAEEAFTMNGIDCLNEYLAHQEAWSDVPIILLTSGSGRQRQFKIKRLEVFVTSGNVTLLERPLQPLTLLTTTQVALRARRRQFEVRDLLISQQEATNIRDEFISIASHELKTPLTSLKLQTQLTKKHFDTPEKFSAQRMQKQLDYTVNQINRLNKLVDDMLDISRINTGKLMLEKESMNLSHLLLDLIDRFNPQFESVGCQIVTDVSENVCGEWDSYKLEQVINNLFSNAIRYSPHKTISIGLKVNDKFALLSVKDEGMGISSANIERIFERFERASSASSGLGLGLYITRQILDLHKGKISVVSEVGKGSTFLIELPLQS